MVPLLPVLPVLIVSIGTKKYGAFSMKNAKLLLYILLLCNVSVQAANVLDKNRAANYAITIYNDAEYDINVGFPYLLGPSGVQCSLKKHTSKLYKINPYYFYINKCKIGVGTCINYDDQNRCTDFHFGMTDDYYNLELVSVIHILSYSDIRITCDDGTTTSCVANLNIY